MVRFARWLYNIGVLRGVTTVVDDDNHERLAGVKFF